MPTTTGEKITSFEVIDHGFDNASYFQGCGTSFTDYAHVVTGVGSNQQEAYNDALESIASRHSVDLNRLQRHGNAHYFRTRVSAENRKAMSHDMSEWYYHLSIRYSL